MAVTRCGVLIIMATFLAIFHTTCARDDCKSTTAVTTHRGREFIITYPKLIFPDNDMVIYLASRLDGSATLTSNTVPNSSYSLTAGRVKLISVHTRSLSQTSYGRQRKYIIIRTTVDVAVYVSLYNIGGTAAAFLVMPVNAMASHYIVASYMPLHDSSLLNQVIVTAMTDNTNVTITSVNGSRSSAVLGAMESYNVQSQLDLSGTRIDSSAPVSAIVGNECAEIPSGVIDCDSLLDSVLPVSRWDTAYIVPPVYPRSRYLIRVFTHTTTHVTYYDTSRTENKTVPANTYIEIMAGTLPTVIISDHTVMVVQYGLGENYDSTYGDPFMMTVPSIGQYDANYIIPVDHYGLSDTLVVMLETNYKDGLRLDGQPIHDGVRWNVSGSFGSYTVIAVVLHNASLLTHNSAGVTYGAMLYGLKHRNAMGFQLGFRYADHECQHGGQYTDGRCFCTGGYTGTCCEIAWTSPSPHVVSTNSGCLSSPCHSASTCISVTTGYRCICAHGYTGVHCSTDIDECVNGTCINTNGGYQCRCDSGYTGRNCTYQTSTPVSSVNPCLFNLCHSGSTCLPTTSGGYMCLYTHGFTGPDCSTATGQRHVCFACEDSVHQRYCDIIKHCKSGDVCYITQYHTTEGHPKYMSGCIQQALCHSLGGSCLECCHGNYCNSAGCGEPGFSAMGHHGPMCLDCAHVGNVSECDQVTLCTEGEVCSIEEYDWGNEKNYKLGCTNKNLCTSEIRQRRSPGQRSVPSCRSCCHGNFCNTNCTAVDQPMVG